MAFFVLSGRTDNHSCLGIDSVFQLLEIDRPLRSRRCPGGTVLGRVERNVANRAAGHLDIANVPVDDIEHVV